MKKRKGKKLMEFEYTGTIYIDVDAIFERCREWNWIDADEIRDATIVYIDNLDDDTPCFVEGWMIDEIVTEVKKRIDKELGL